MTKREQYGLEFYKISSDGIIGYNCRRKDWIVDQNNSLQFLSYLDRAGTEFLLWEINAFLNADDLDRSIYESMILDHVELDIEYTDFRIDERPYTFPLADIKDLLKEWLDFLKA
ncbi:hypothetical protein FY557_08370 [Chryseobacterium sp. SN22]|uniref:hypothetical protein n=1 Tax=Chryseobacterium sp. SN22 TaxID=2606431 RepID=UPI0011EF7DE1|nr:hypothetical protein [Chryseobacterium sp. SN22]KAA0128583.1 hypothetical protein FY557_08370 [Chryseobacterium sp. SN22]